MFNNNNIDSLVQITNLANRMGMLGFAMFAQGNIHDHQTAVTIESHRALSFFQEVLYKDYSDMAQLFELWTITRYGKGKG